jgi:hypothetical protein
VSISRTVFIIGFIASRASLIGFNKPFSRKTGGNENKKNKYKKTKSRKTENKKRQQKMNNKKKEEKNPKPRSTVAVFHFFSFSRNTFFFREKKSCASDESKSVLLVEAHFLPFPRSTNVFLAKANLFFYEKQIYPSMRNKSVLLVEAHFFF